MVFILKDLDSNINSLFRNIIFNRSTDNFWLFFGSVDSDFLFRWGDPGWSYILVTGCRRGSLGDWRITRLSIRFRSGYSGSLSSFTLSRSSSSLNSFSWFRSRLITFWGGLTNRRCIVFISAWSFSPWLVSSRCVSLHSFVILCTRISSRLYSCCFFCLLTSSHRFF